MATKANSNTNAAKLMQLGMAVPQVMTHRLTRMALSGPVLSKRDQKEFSMMVAEKQTAFFHSWLAMMTEMGRIQQQWFWGAFTGTAPRLDHAFDAVTAKAIEPIRRTAVSNARRLSKTKLR